ncbi:MAG: TrpR-like protein [Oscillospiraceae bacterium]|nr:TrpR-like protein [Oscillospiraceae bacterium]
MKPGNNINPSDDLYRAILTLETVDECKKFLVDLCTRTELSALEQRFQAAIMLSEGKVYTDIMDATGASSATISRVSRAINYGDGGYATAIERLKK